MQFFHIISFGNWAQKKQKKMFLSTFRKSSKHVLDFKFCGTSQLHHIFGALCLFFVVNHEGCCWELGSNWNLKNCEGGCCLQQCCDLTQFEELEDYRCLRLFNCTNLWQNRCLAIWKGTNRKSMQSNPTNICDTHFFSPSLCAYVTSLSLSTVPQLLNSWRCCYWWCDVH